MTLKEFDSMNSCGNMYQIINANEIGYLSKMNPVYEADRNASIAVYGDCEMLGFSARGKNKIAVFLKITEQNSM